MADVAPTKKKHSHFWRACRFLIPRRGLVVASIVCAIFVGLTSTGGLATLLPILRVLLHDNESVPNWLNRWIIENRLKVKFIDDPGSMQLAQVSKGGAAFSAGLLPGEALALSQSPEAPAGAAPVEVLSDPQTASAVLLVHGNSVPMRLPRVSAVMAAARRLTQRVPTNPVWGMAWIFGVFTFLSVISNILRYFQEHLSDKAAILAVDDIRRKLYDHVLRMPVGFFSARGTSDVTSRLVQDANGLQDGFKTVLGQSIQEPIKALFAFAMALYLDWHFTLLIVLFAPLMFWLIQKFGKKMRRASRKALQSSSVMLGQLEGTLIGLKVVKAANAERYERRRYRGIMHGLIDEQLRMSRIDAASSPVLETLTLLFVGAILLYATYLVRVARTLDADKFFTLMACLMMIGESLRKFSKVNNALQKSNAAAARIFETLDGEVERTREAPARRIAVAAEDDRPQKTFTVLPVIGRDVRFENITFAYPGSSAPALLNVNLTVSKGESVAIVGRNGSGKTTLLALLPRFFDPQQGRIAIDGLDIRQVTLRSLRRQISIVTQEAVIFPGTIAQNIAYGLPLACRDANVAAQRLAAIEAAARRAFAHDFIMEKPQGYQTILGEHGAQLSGGQRQRLCIARAIYRDNPILVLDEATSQVDAESEHLIQQAIENLMHERTTFVIAHRFSTILSADRIIVLDRGQIVGQGRHEGLMQSCEVYEQLYERQMLTTSTESGAPAAK